MPRFRIPAPRLFLVVLLAAGLLAPLRLARASESASESTHGAPAEAPEAPKAEGAGTKEGEAPKEGEAHAEPTYRLGPALDGHFDLATLRAGPRVTSFRYPLADLRATIASGTRQGIQVRISIALEFGSESGLAEVQRAKTEVISIIETALGQTNARKLTTPGGKLELKESMIRALDQRLRTAQVRQIYFTDFILIG